MSSLLIRDAHLADARAILLIYNYGVLETTAVWTEEPSTLAGREAWLRERQGRGYPVLVAEIEDTVVGFATFGDFRVWPGYRHTVEDSIYVAAGQHRRGIGRGLMASLIARARQARKHVMVAGIEAGNTASIALHADVGFRQVAYMPQVGTKFGRWLDLVLMQIVLDQAPPGPLPGHG
ncbi:GNAT family N-acetyltransferase [Chelatococcus reniformis]|uniref:Phosphinothricin acetyltransferase n=1 Tax=Chelatococcus reniformis TaxID=1494448 RepID=A0A916UKR0_9HYPH|nr:GNAT family N-acetyltransferase [Chelatococcus reniformis]GGC77066.1 phosphinothricin acetyltransferase [Chelatococcus reniformis]